MTPRQQRMMVVGGIVVGVAAAAWLALRAFEQNVMLFYDPTAITTKTPPAEERFRLGGMVAKGSVKQAAGTLDIEFLVTDFKHTVPVKYHGILPDLFREGQGVVAHGRLQHGVFVADEILAKHDEKYMPPQVAESLKNNPPPPDAMSGT
ncbi:MAG TPA: cytochrome c maturation protein CcmE [Steroidobacteraceae bacterium]|nr:cytochrome c maturation protein CcmE [Steroidobacteraceae bacterium]